MKILAILVFIVNSISSNCNENVFGNFKDQNILMEQVENSPQDVFYEKPQENDYLLHDSFRPKHYFSEPAGRIQYMIIRNTDNVPQSRKYSDVHSMAEQLTYNKDPSKYSYAYSTSISQKAKARPIKIVRNGPVKHIYLNIPKYVIKPPQILHNEEIEPYRPSDHYQHNVEQQNNYYTPSIQNEFVPSSVKVNAISEVNKDMSAQGLNAVSSGYSIGGTNDQIQNYGQVFSNSANSNHYVGHEYNFGQNHGPQLFNNPDHSSFSPQFISSKFPQFSSDGKQQYSYDIPDEYKSLFNNNDYVSTSQFNQPQIFAQQQFQSIPHHENYNVDKMRRISEISGFEPDLINMVNAALNHEQESPEYINSNEKSVHMLHGTVSPAFKANFN